MTKVIELDAEGLAQLPATCRACVFWESAQAPRGPTPDGSGRAAKESAWQATQLEWGSAGKAAYRDGRCVGYASFGPPEQVPRLRQLGWSCSEDAMILATMWVHPEHRCDGIGRALLQGCLSEAHRRGVQALEAVAERKGALSTSCVLPADFLLANGFAVLHDRGRFPMLRLELSQTARWSPLAQALDAVLERLGRRVGVRRPALGASHPRAVRQAEAQPSYEAISAMRGGDGCCASKK